MLENILLKASWGQRTSFPPSANQNLSSKSTPFTLEEHAVLQHLYGKTTGKGETQIGDILVLLSRNMNEIMPNAYAAEYAAPVN